MKPVLYLDIDDTILSFPPHAPKSFWERYPKGRAADGAKEFLHWAVEHFDVRWLTCWTASGVLHPERQTELAELMDVPESVLHKIWNPRPYSCTDKTQGIDFGDPREFVWVEDSASVEELEILLTKGVRGSFYPTNTSLWPDALMRVSQRLSERFHLPWCDFSRANLS